MFSTAATRTRTVIVYAPDRRQPPAGDSAPCAPPPPLVGVVNASAPPQSTGGSHWLMGQIEALESRLCALMARPAASRQLHDTGAMTADTGAAMPGTDEVAADIALLTRYREQLAQRTAAGLFQWQQPTTTPFTLRPGELRARIQRAGVTGIMRYLRIAELSSGQRLRIGEVLRDAGARPQTIRAWLGLDVDTLKDSKAASILDVMLPQAQSEELDLIRAYSIKVSQQRADLWQRVDATNRNFGYTRAKPAWNYMPSENQSARVKQLRTLSGMAESHRRGINVPLPWQ